MSSLLNPPLRIGLVGLGLVGAYHRERMALREDLRVVALYDSSAEVRQAFQRGRERLHESWQGFLADPEIDAVWIATPPASHQKLAEEVLRSGKSVIIEPPLVLDSRDGERLIETLRKVGKTVVVAHTRRWDEDFQQVLGLVRAGTLGTVLSLRLTCWSYNPPHLRQRRSGETSWRDLAETGGGILWELGSHFFDQLLELVPAAPKEVYAHATAPSRSIDDGFVVLVRFPQGVTATLDLSRAALAPINSGWEIAGASGAYAGGVLFTATPEGEVEDFPLAAPPAASDPFYTAVVDHLCSDGPNPAPACRSLQVVRLIDAVRHSAETGEPVQLPVAQEN
jgi:predicted dehydrogenase